MNKMASMDKFRDYKTPGQLIQALLDERGWTQQILALVLNEDQPTINRMIANKKKVTAEIAILLEEVFGIPAALFLGLQQSYDLAKAKIVARPDPMRATRAHLFGKLPITEMNKRGWIEADDTRNVNSVESALVKFFGVSSVDEIEILPHAPKKTDVAAETTPVQLAWLYRVKQIAADMLVPRYSPGSVDGAIKKLQNLLSAVEEARKAPRILAEAGIRFVIVETLTSAKIDGVCFWLNPSSPVIGMTLRFDRIDNFWFCLRHELEHVKRLHGQTSPIVIDADIEGNREIVAEQEVVADTAASEFCVPKNRLDAFIARKAPFFYERDILGFAKILGIHPGLIAGQLRRRMNQYNRFTNHLAKIRSIVAPSATVDGWGDVYPLNA